MKLEDIAGFVGWLRLPPQARPDLRAEINRLRERHGPASSAPRVPDQQRASDASLLRRLEAATARNRQLEAEVRELRDQLARVLGRQQAAAVTSSGEIHSPRQRPMKTIGPC